MTEFLVVLNILTDDPELEWWEALGLPNPDRWALSDTFRESVFPQVLVEKKVTR